MGIASTAAPLTPRPRDKRRALITTSTATAAADREDARLGIAASRFRVHRVSAASSARGAEPLAAYSRASCWESFARETETVVLALEAKTLLSEICILNKNACTVDVSVAVEDRPRSYINIHRRQQLPHAREMRLKVGFFPCCFVKLEFRRISQPYIAVYGIKLMGVASRAIEADSGPSLCTMLSHTTEHLLFGRSLHMSLPYRDCLSERQSGSPEWMERHRPFLLDEKIHRLEQALFSSSSSPLDHDKY